jgi:glycogen phosphorylase
MKEKTDIKKPVYSLLPSDLDGVDLLAELALDMRWSWNHAADEVWRLLDPALWDLTHNPWVVLRLVEGVDVWINTPRRPWEASGTSGMKVLVNGGINLSELDGWWAEAYTPEVGWALGDGKEHGDDPAWDAIEAGALYDMLERQVVPEFYNRGNNSIPGKWVGRIRKSMS